MMNHIKLSTRIYLQQILIVIVLVGLGIFSLYKLQFINEASLEFSEQDMPMLLLNEKIKVGINEQYYLLMELLSDRKDFEVENNQENKNEVNETNVKIKEIEISNGEAIKSFQVEIDQANSTETEQAMLSILKEFQESLNVITNEEARLSEIGNTLGDTSSNINLETIGQLEEEIRKSHNTLDPKLSVFFDISVKDSNRSVDNIAEYCMNLLQALKIIVPLVTFMAIVMMLLTGFSLRNLRQSVGVISSSVQQVATAASQSGSAISMVSDGAKRQADSISQAVTAVEQSMSVLGEVAKSAEEANNLARTAGGVVKSGKEKMDGMVRVVGRIQENSNKVNKITEIIAGIANQTNMLALNAAIEAARAGEHGKGFAVVADQVKSLAENSKNSVDDIVTLIEQAKIDAVEAVSVANTVNAEMEKIFESSKATERMMINITTAMEEQVSTTEELSRNMDSLRGIGNSNANAAEEITETIIELSRIASDTNTEIKKFNI